MIEQVYWKILNKACRQVSWPMGHVTLDVKKQLRKQVENQVRVQTWDVVWDYVSSQVSE